MLTDFVGQEWEQDTGRCTSSLHHVWGMSWEDFLEVTPAVGDWWGCGRVGEGVLFHDGFLLMSGALEGRAQPGRSVPHPHPASPGACAFNLSACLLGSEGSVLGGEIPSRAQPLKSQKHHFCCTDRRRQKIVACSPPKSPKSRCYFILLT